MPGPLLAPSANGFSAATTATADTSRTLAFSEPYERDGVTVIPASTTRAHGAISALPGRQRRRLDAQTRGARPAGAFVVQDGSARWHPAIDLTRVLTTGEVVIGAVIIAHRLMRRPSAARANVTMGPGGWVSMKGGAMAVRPSERFWRKPAPAREASRRPLWARLLAAKPLQVLLG